MSYPKYAEMKDSGVEWIGKLPIDWELKKVSWIFDIVGSGTTPISSDESYYNGDVAWINTGELNDGIINDARKSLTVKAVNELSALTLYPVGTLLIAMYGATIGKLGILGIEATTNQACCALGDAKDVVTKFIFYWFLGNRPHIISMAYGGGQPNISQELIRQLKVCVPSIAEQQAIVNFLDDKTARIDVLINKKERQLELLAEKRQAVISEAVTKGLNRNAPLHDSGVKWLGEVPAHWEVKPLMHLTPVHRQIMYGIVLPGPHVENGVPIVKGGDVIAHKLRLEMLSRTTPEIEAGHKKSRLKGGDIVYAIRGSIGMAEIVPTELEGANLTQDAARISPLKGANRMWLLFALKSHPVFAQLDAGAVGATIRGINIRDLKRAYIPVPSTEEQNSIAIYLERESSESQLMADKIQTQINKLREYRQALITAAVTGKIDVRGEAI